VTANTGHVRASPRVEVADEVLVSLRRLVAVAATTGAPIGVRHPGDTWTWTAAEAPGALAVAVIDPDGRPVARFAVGADGGDHARAAWDVVAADAAPDPASLTRPPAPWLIVALLPDLTRWDPARWRWLGDFERCVAWAWLDLIEGAAAPDPEIAWFRAVWDAPGGAADA